MCPNRGRQVLRAEDRIGRDVHRPTKPSTDRK